MKTCYIYIRTAQFQDRADNIPNLQKRICIEYAKKHNYKVLGIFEDLGVSGNTLKRKGMQLLLKESGKHPSNIVLVSRVDRISRSYADFTQINKTFEKRGIELTSVSEGNYKFTLNILAAIAQYERERSVKK